MISNPSKMAFLPPLLCFVDGTSDVIDDCIFVIVVVASFQKPMPPRCSMEETNAAILLRRVDCTPTVAACWILMARDDGGAAVVTALPRLPAPSLPPLPPFTTAATTTLSSVVKTKNNNNNNDDSPLILSRRIDWSWRRD
jgi:hypothetical protein